MKKALNKSAFCSNNSPFYFLERAFGFGKSAFGFAVRKSCETFIRLCVWFCSLFGSKGRLLCGGGIIHIKFSENHTREIKSKNVAKTLDNIIYQLMAPPHVKRTTKWIKEILEGRRPYTVEEIEKLKIWVILDV